MIMMYPRGLVMVKYYQFKQCDSVSEDRLAYDEEWDETVDLQSDSGVDAQNLLSNPE